MVYTDTYDPATAWVHLVREGGRWKIDDIAYGPKDGGDSFARYAITQLGEPLPPHGNNPSGDLIGR